MVAALGALIDIRRPGSEPALHDRAGTAATASSSASRSHPPVASARRSSASRDIEQYIPVWHCAIVGLHILLLAPVPQNLGPLPLGAAVTIVAIDARPSAPTTEFAANTVIAVGAGLLLLAHAVGAQARAALAS
jgi:hypothetical protein